MNNGRVKSIKYNFIMNMILTASSVVFPLITFPYVSRVLLPEGTGKVTFATSLIYYFAMIAQLGIPTYGVNACAKVRDDRGKLTRVTHELLTINLVMSVVAYIGLALVLIIFPTLHADRSLYVLISVSILFDTLAMEWLYKALEQYDYITIRSLIFKTVATAATFLLVHSKEDYFIYGAVSISSSLGCGIFNFLNARKHIDFRYVGGYDLKRHLKPVIVFFLIVCASTVYTHMDTLMLGILKSDVDVGYYNVSVKVRNILVSVVAALGSVLLPRTSYYVEQGMMEEFRSICSKAMRFVFLLAIPLSVFFVLYAKECVYLISGAAYKTSILPMQVLMPTLLSIGMGNIVGIQMLVPLGREKTILKSEVTGAVVNIIANSLLIPRYAALGAAIGTLIAEITVTGIQVLALKQDVSRMLGEMPYFKMFTALFFAIIGSLWVKSVGLSDFVAFLIAATLFFGGYFGTLLLTKEPFIWGIFQQVLELAGKILRKIGIKQ